MLAPGGVTIRLLLLEKVCKLFERVIAWRKAKHLAHQVGFRQGHSTVDAVMCVKALAEEVHSRGELVLAESLYIANTFNTLPWSCTWSCKNMQITSLS